MRYADIKYPDTTNGLGVRVSLWVSGCNFHCVGCHNAEIWSFESGEEFTDKELRKILDLLNKPWVAGLSVLGGEPLQQDNTLENVLAEVKRAYPDKDIWLWTGYKYEDIKDKPILKYVDVLIDGQYEQDKRDLRLEFRGSSNQKIVRLKDGHVIMQQ